MKNLLLIILSFFVLQASAQVQLWGNPGGYTLPSHLNIGAGKTKVTHPSAFLELGDSIFSKKGFLPPRGWKDSIKIPVKGMIIHDIPLNKPVWYDGNSWQLFGSTSGADSTVFATRYWTGNQYAPISGSGNYIWNNYGAAQNANLHVRRGRFAGLVTLDSVLQLGTFATNPTGTSNGAKWYNLTTGQFIGNRGGALLNFLMTGDVSAGNVIYVEQNNANATDTRTGLSKYSLDRPFLTIKAAQAVASPNDIVYVRGGGSSTNMATVTYAENAIPLNSKIMILDNAIISSSADYSLLLNVAQASVQYTVIGVGRATITNTSGSYGIFACGNTGTGGHDVRFMNITLSSSGNIYGTKSYAATSINYLMFDNCIVSAATDMITGPTNGIYYTVNNSRLSSSGGRGLFFLGKNNSNASILNSYITTYGDCIYGTNNSASQTTGTAIENSTISSTNGAAFSSNIAYSNGTFTLRKTTIRQNTASTFTNVTGTVTFNLSACDITTTGATVFSGVTTVTAANTTSNKAISSSTATFSAVGRFSATNISIPSYTPTSSADTNGTEGDLTRDASGNLYFRTSTGWLKFAGVSF